MFNPKIQDTWNCLHWWNFLCVRVASSLLLLLLFAINLFGQGIAGWGSSESRGWLGPVGSSKGSNFSISLIVENTIRQGESPGFATCIRKTRPTKHAFAYLCVLSHNYKDKEKDDFTYRLWIEKLEGVLKQTIQINDTTLTIDYRTIVNDGSGQLELENLWINNKKINLMEGRVFLINFRKPVLTAEQVDCVLPIPVAVDGQESYSQKVWREQVEPGLQDGKFVAKAIDFSGIGKGQRKRVQLID